VTARPTRAILLFALVALGIACARFLPTLDALHAALGEIGRAHV